jgi:hypothetical protein
VLLPFLHQNLALDGSGPIAKSPSRV